MKTSVKLLIVTISLEFILSLIAIIVLSNEIKSNLVVGSGKMIKTKQVLKSFKMLQLSGNVTVHWKKSDSTYVDLQTDSLFTKEITMMVENEILKVSAPKIFRKKKMVFVLYSPDIMEIHLNEGAVLLADDTLKGNLLKMNINKGADAKIKFNGRSGEFNVNDGSELNVVGISQYVLVKAYKGSDVKVDHLEVQNGKIVATDGSSVSLMVKDTLVVKARNGSNVNIYGNPKIKQIEADVSSSVE